MYPVRLNNLTGPRECQWPPPEDQDFETVDTEANSSHRRLSVKLEFEAALKDTFMKSVAKDNRVILRPRTAEDPGDESVAFFFKVPDMNLGIAEISLPYVQQLTAEEANSPSLLLWHWRAQILKPSTNCWSPTSKERSGNGMSMQFSFPT